MSIVNYTLKRIFSLVPIVFGVMFLTFILAHFMPGNPYLFKIGERATASQIEWYNLQIERMGLNKPILVQFWIYFMNAFGQFFSYLIIGVMGGIVIYYIMKIINSLIKKIQDKRKSKREKLKKMAQKPIFQSKQYVLN